MLFRSETSNIRLLDLWIVKIIEIVEDDDFMIGSEQLFNQVRPNKAGAACHQDSHGAQLATDAHGWTLISQQQPRASTAAVCGLISAAEVTALGCSCGPKSCASAAANKSSLARAHR